MTQALIPSNPMPREMSLAELGRRIQLNKASGWGLEGGTSEQLNLLALYCQKFRLLPGEEVTLYQGKPYITIDGRVTLMRRHSDYRGHSMRPLSKDEKEAWGYDAGDLVVEATVRTERYGDIVGYGKVSAAERIGKATRGNPVAVQHPVEMAQKRALARAERYAFGTEVIIDDDEVEEAARTVIEQRTAPELVAANAKRHDEIFPDEEDLVVRGDQLVSVKTGEVVGEALPRPDVDAREADRQRKQEDLI